MGVHFSTTAAVAAVAMSFWGPTMKFALASVLLLASASNALAAGGFNFTFDSDAQGWTRGDYGNGFAAITVASNGAANWGSSSGNGYLAGSDHATYAFHFSPNLGAGYGYLFGQMLELDFQTSGSGGNNPFVVLLSSTSYLVKLQAHTASADLKPYAYSLDAAGGWYINSSPYHDGDAAVLATDADVLAVLNDLRHVGISTDITSSSDSTRTDNVRAVPAPGVGAILALGGLLGARRRR